MANTNAPYGMRPVMNGDGSPWNGITVVRYIPSNDVAAYYVGDTVLSAAVGDANGVPGVIKAAATDVPRGVITSILPVPDGPVASLDGSGTNLAEFYIPATKTKAYYVTVCEDPHTIFMIQGDATATNQTSANGNKNAKFTVAAPSPARPFSATVLDSSSIATTNTFMLKLTGLARIPGNVVGAYAQWYVRFNVHELFGSTSGV